MSNPEHKLHHFSTDLLPKKIGQVREIREEAGGQTAKNITILTEKGTFYEKPNCLCYL